MPSRSTPANIYGNNEKRLSFFASLIVYVLYKIHNTLSTSIVAIIADDLGQLENQLTLTHKLLQLVNVCFRYETEEVSAVMNNDG